MDFDALHGTSIILLGKSRALSQDELLVQLKAQDIAVVEGSEAPVSLIVEGRMMNPVEQQLRDTWYEEKRAPFVSIDALERWLCEKIDSAKLMMSLKLSGDRERLLGYLKNPLIDNGVFLKLLGMYDWGGDGFFDNDENRDVTAALIERFYENIERNHNVQYANTGLMHLLAHHDAPELINAIAGLAPLKQALKKGCDPSTRNILEALATHPATSEQVLQRFITQGDGALRQRVAGRVPLSLSLQQALLALKDEGVNGVLAQNPSLEQALAMELEAVYGELIAEHIHLDEALFEYYYGKYPKALAVNPTVTRQMQQKLYCLDDTVQQTLAGNPHAEETMLMLLYETNKPEVVRAIAANPATPAEILSKMAWNQQHHAALAANPSSPVALLESFATSEDVEVLTALAKNHGTPASLLYQLQLDKRLERYVKENPSFGAHIQRENIGWL